MGQTRRKRSFQIEARRAVIEGRAPPQSRLFELMRAARIACVGDDVEHDAAVCLGCDRLVGCRATADGAAVIIRCWVQRDGGRGSEGGPGTGPACSSCRSRVEVAPHPRMPEVPICRDCLERSRAPVEYLELGVGD